MQQSSGNPPSIHNIFNKTAVAAGAHFDDGFRAWSAKRKRFILGLQWTWKAKLKKKNIQFLLRRNWFTDPNRNYIFSLFFFSHVKLNSEQSVWMQKSRS